MAYFLQTLVFGLEAAAIYCLLALGLSMSLGVARLVNFAHTTFMAFGGLIAASLIIYFHASLTSYIFAVICGALATGLLALVCERFLFPARSLQTGSALLVSIGLIIILENGMTQIFGGGGLYISPVVEGTWAVHGVYISYVGIIQVCVAAILIATYFLFIRYTGIGSEWRAVSQDASAAELLGVRVRLHRSLTFAIGTGIAGVSGGLLLLNTPMTPLSGDGYIAIAFAAVIIGGLGHPLGALIGGLIIALAQAFAGAYGNSEYINIVAMAVMVLVLIVKPLGIWGKELDLR